MKTKNIKKELEKAIEPFLKLLIARKEVIGIVLLGGLGKRNFLDKYSDLDISIFIKEKDKDKFSLPFEFHYPYKSNELEFNLHQQIIEVEEKKEKWDSGKIEAYSRGKIIYDPSKRVTNMIQNKIKFNDIEAFNRLIWITQQYIWRGHIHSIRAIKRGYPETAHDLVNQCQDLLLEAIYLLNKRYLPHKKWAFVYLKEMPLKYKQFHKFFMKSMLIKKYTLKDVKRRLKALDTIYFFIKKETIKKYPSFPKNPYEYYYRHFIQIKENTTIDDIFNQLEKIKKMSKEMKRKIYGELCFNLITNKNLLNRLFYSDNIDKLEINKYQNEFRENNGYRKKRKN